MVLTGQDSGLGILEAQYAWASIILEAQYALTKTWGMRMVSA